MKVEDSKDQIADNKDNRCGDNLVKGVLKEASEPAPEEPLKFRNDKERNEYRADKNADSRGDKSISDDDDGNCLCRCKQNYDNGVDDGPENVGNAGRIQAHFEVSNALNNGLKFSLDDLVGTEWRLIGDEIRKT